MDKEKIEQMQTAIRGVAIKLENVGVTPFVKSVSSQDFIANMYTSYSMYVSPEELEMNDGLGIGKIVKIRMIDTLRDMRDDIDESLKALKAS